MAKFLLFIAVLAVIYAVVGASKRRSKPPPPAAQQPDAMAQCTHCGVHFPRAESVSEGGRDFCCEEHRRLGARP